MRPYGRQILICEHGDCAPPEAAQRLAGRFRALAQAHGLTRLRNQQRVKCTLSDCLGVCAGGPILVVYPDGTWYHHVDDALLERIVNEHLLADRPVDAHIFHRLGADGVVPPEAAPPVYAPDYSGDADAADQPPAGTQLGSTPEAIARRLAARTARKQKGLLIVYTGKGKGKTTAAPRSRPSWAPLMALPYPILRCMSRLRRTALRLAPGHTGGAAAPRAREEPRRGVAAPIRLPRGRRQKAV
jgi:cob(I)alamin adenosyltransferase